MYSSVSLLLALATIGIATEEVKLQVPDVPPIGTLTLDGSFQGYSMELASYPDIAGNKRYVESSWRWDTKLTLRQLTKQAFDSHAAESEGHYRFASTYSHWRHHIKPCYLGG